MSQFTRMMLSEAYLRVYTKGKAVIFTEDQDDIFFWKNIFENKDIGYKVLPIVSLGNANGKPELLKIIEHLHKHLFIALDSDFNYVCKTYQEDLHNKFINTPFIFQTYTYSKESYEYDIDNIHKYLSYIYYSKDIDSGFDVFINDFFSICFKVVVYITFMLENGVVFNRSDFEKFLKFSKKDFFYVNDVFINLANINLINLNKMIDDNYSGIVDVNSIKYKNHLTYIESIGINREVDQEI